MFKICSPRLRIKGHAVAYLLEALYYRLEGRSIPDEVIGFFSIDVILPAALWQTQLVTEMSTKNYPGG
jgi:hypothetical protein